MMRDHLYRRLAVGMAAGLLIQAAPPAQAAGGPGNFAELVEIPGGRHLHLERHGSGGPTLLPGRTPDRKRHHETISNTHPGHTGLGSQTGA